MVTAIDLSKEDHSFLITLHGLPTATPAYLLWGAAAGTDVVIRGKTRMSLYLIGANLTDRAYMPHLSRLKYIGICNMGRSVTFKMTVPW